MIKYVKSEDFIDALISHLDKTKNHVPKMEMVFDSIDRKATCKKCESIIDLIKDAD